MPCSRLIVSLPANQAQCGVEVYGTCRRNPLPGTSAKCLMVCRAYCLPNVVSAGSIPSQHGRWSVRSLFCLANAFRSRIPMPAVAHCYRKDHEALFTEASLHKGIGRYIDTNRSSGEATNSGSTRRTFYGNLSTCDKRAHQMFKTCWIS